MYYLAFAYHFKDYNATFSTFVGTSAETLLGAVHFFFLFTSPFSVDKTLVQEGSGYVWGHIL